MIVEQWGNVLASSFQNLWFGLVQYVPNLVIALVILLVGWIIGALLGRVVAQVVRSLKVDDALRKAGVEDMLQKGGMLLDSGHFVGSLVKWFIIIVFLVAALDVLQLNQVTNFLQEVVLLYLPRVIVAVLILLVSAVIGDLLQRAVTTSAKTAEVKHAALLGKVAKWAIWIFAILAALSQLEIAKAFVETTFTGVIVAISIAVGLAFGLGGQDAAARFIEKTRDELTHGRSGN